MIDSILDGTKKILGLDASYTVFDHDIVTHINTALSDLDQLGLGPEFGFQVVDSDATWDEFIGGDPRLSSIQSYVYLRVRMLFDPPPTSFAIAAMQDQINELAWRLNARYEDSKPVPPPPVDDVLDGGEL